MATPRTSLPSLWNEAVSGFPIGSLRKQIDQIFDDFNRGASLPTLFGGEFMPSTELKDTDKETVVSVELPGVDQKDVNISVSDRTIEISGEKKSEVEHKNDGGYRSERSYGSFSRSFTLPYAIDASKVDARFDKGVLTVKIAKPAEAQTQTKHIPIHG